jgi:hypothetical protein
MERSWVPDEAKMPGKAIRVWEGSPTEVRREVGPHEALLREVWRTTSWVEYYEQALTDLTPDEMAEAHLTFMRMRNPAAFNWREMDNEHTRRMGTLGALRDLYDKERTHQVKSCQIAVQCGVEERKIHLAEEQARQVGVALYAIVKSLADRFGFDADSQEVRNMAHDTLVSLSRVA